MRWPGSLLILVTILFGLLTPVLSLRHAQASAGFTSYCGNPPSKDAAPGTGEHRDNGLCHGGTCCPLPLAGHFPSPSPVLLSQAAPALIERALPPAIGAKRHIFYAAALPRAPPHAFPRTLS